MDRADCGGGEDATGKASTPRPRHGSSRRSSARSRVREGQGTGAAEMDGLFVDDVPAAVNGRSKQQNDLRPRAKSKRSRPSDRRKAEGFEEEAPRAAQTHGQHGQHAEGPPTQRPEHGPSATSSRLSYAVGVLTCVKGTEEGLALNLIEGTYTIGRGRDNNFVLKDIAASRSHIQIEVHDNCVTVTDMKSGNGSRVNGRRIRNAVLKDGDLVEIGNTSLRFEYHGNDRSREINHPHNQANGHSGNVSGLADSQRRQPTQERIAEAADRLAAELSERIRNDDDFDQIETAQLQSNPRADSPIGPPLMGAPLRSPAQVNGSLVAAIDNMVKDVSSPAALQVGELWNETATNVPLSDIIPADDPRRPAALRSPAVPVQQAQAMQQAMQQGIHPQGHPPQGMPPPTEPSFIRPLATQAPPLAAPPPLQVPVPPTAPPKKSRALLISFLVFVFIVTVGVGGFVAWYFLSPLLNGAGAASTVVSTETQGEYTIAIANASMAMTDKDYDVAEAHAREALKLVPNDVTATKMLKRIIEEQDKRSGGQPKGKGKGAKKKAGSGGPAGVSSSSASAAPTSAAPTSAAPTSAAAPTNAVSSKSEKKAAPKKAKAKAQPPRKKVAVKKAAPVKKAAVKRKPKSVKKATPVKKTPVKKAPVKKAKPAPKPKKKSPGMTEAQAKKAMRSALTLKREDPEAACVKFRKIAKNGPPDSRWVDKAKNWVARCR